MRTLTILTCTLLLSLGACGGKSPAPADPDVENEDSVADDGDEPSDVEVVDRPAEACAPVLEHIQSVVVEAIDVEGMMEACQHEWSAELVACMDSAQNDDDVASCW